MPSAARSPPETTISVVNACTSATATLAVAAILVITSAGRSVQGTLTSTLASKSCTFELLARDAADTSPWSTVTIGRRLSTRELVPPTLGVTCQVQRAVSDVRNERGETDDQDDERADEQVRPLHMPTKHLHRIRG
jgi:hypothetical protein